MMARAGFGGRSFRGRLQKTQMDSRERNRAEGEKKKCNKSEERPAHFSIRYARPENVTRDRVRCCAWLKRRVSPRISVCLRKLASSRAYVGLGYDEEDAKDPGKSRTATLRHPARARTATAFRPSAGASAGKKPAMLCSDCPGSAAAVR